MITIRMKRAVGTIACARVRVMAAIDRNIIDIVRVRKNDIRTKKKKGPGSLLKFVMK